MRPLSATIDLAALRHNLAVARQHAPHSKVMAVVKANAYGHGLERAALALADADGFALVEIEGAVRLRELGYMQRIVLLEGFFEPRELDVLVDYDLTTVVHSLEQIEMVEAAHAVGAGVGAFDVLLKVNTGMNRLGVQPRDFASALDRLQRSAAVRSVALATHFANADDARGIAEQLSVFQALVASIDPPRSLSLSLANSAAVLRYPEAHADWIRPGIMLYGCSPFPAELASAAALRPAMTLASEIIAVRNVAAGATLGYGGAFTASAPLRVGVVACGYADGYPRHAPTGTPAVVNGRLTRTLGRVSMDMLCVDLTGFDDAGVGARVVLWGESNPVERVAEAAGTVGYELLCALAPRVQVIERG